ncbi:hypothetical protein [Nitrosomonas communis]|uniref:Nickel/cobalt transporter regulator n=1 Tax=Nitrosomonas communis TaxID=44574 RepID=A0A1I4RIJ0_9PROT|nr:hypothetical protein [Nitrosomonas communis]SFM51730.1 hypothetical protein SAMN05421863_10337 [Nitrosomonas communis]
MTRILMIMIFTVSSLAFSNDEHAPKERRIYQTDSIGTVVTDRPPYVIQWDGRILPTDSIGTRDAGSHNQYRIIEDRVYETDSIGTVRPERPLRTR